MDMARIDGRTTRRRTTRRQTDKEEPKKKKEKKRRPRNIGLKGGSTRPDTSDCWRQCTRASRRRSTGLIGARENFHHLPVQPDNFDKNYMAGRLHDVPVPTNGYFLGSPQVRLRSSLSHSCHHARLGIALCIYFMKAGMRARSDPPLDHVGLLKKKKKPRQRSKAAPAV